MPELSVLPGFGPAAPVPYLALFSDFGVAGPYVGQVLAVWAALAPGIPAFDLFSGAAPFDAAAGGVLLHALAVRLPRGGVVAAVIDPGVGGERDVLALRADGLWFCGPDNGLLAAVAARAERAEAWRVTWRPERLSATFHGRDLFAPIAAGLARSGRPPREAESIAPGTVAGFAEGGRELWRIVAADRYGNLMSGVRAATVPSGIRIAFKGRILSRAERFGSRPEGGAFWYENANGLVEIAVNRGSAAEVFGGNIGDALEAVADDEKSAGL